MNLLRKAQEKTCYGSEVFIFNLPAPETCKPTKWCLLNCYAIRDDFNQSQKDSAIKMYEISKLEIFPDLVVREIKENKVKLFRLHSSGDFYSQEYVKKWIKIAQNCPNTFFRTSTRRIDLSRIIRKLNDLPNFVVRESLDSSRCKSSMRLPLIVIENVPIAKSFFRCLLDCNKCGHYCWFNKVNINLPIFGYGRD